MAASSAATAAALAAQFGAAHPLGPQLPVDPAVLQAWMARADDRFDEHAAGITGVGVRLVQTIEHAKVAMQLIVDNVAGELTGFQRTVHNDTAR